MWRGLLMNGVIHPLEPLPPEWEDGQEATIEAAGPDDPEAIERWAREMDALCADIDPEDCARMQAAIDEQRREAKEWMRRHMGLPDESIVIKIDPGNP